MKTSIANKREKLLAIATAGVLLGAIVFIVVIEPQLKKYKASAARTNYLRLKLAKIRGDLLVKDRIDSAYARIEPLIAGSETTHQEMSAFTRELDDLYSKLQVRIRTIKILANVNEDFYRRLAVRIEMTGSIAEIVRFIHSVETHPNPMRIEQFELKAREIVDSVNATFLVTKVVARQRIEDSLDNEGTNIYTAK
jgi:Tfp pilus assembly protein PilO